MDNNEVRLSGTVKRDARAGNSGSNEVLDFAVEVMNERGRYDIYDCRLTSQSAAYEQLEGFVSAGEPIEVIGHLAKRTTTESNRVAGILVEIKSTNVFIYVDSVVVEDD